jgi:hypothetical protein
VGDRNAPFGAKVLFTGVVSPFARTTFAWADIIGPTFLVH